MRNLEQRFAEGVTSKPNGRRWIAYRGTRQALLAAGVVTEEMFPPAGKKRKFLLGDGDSRLSAQYFCVSTIEDGRLFSVTRWMHWNDPEKARKAEELDSGGQVRVLKSEPSGTAGLSDEAISIAEGWSIMPPRIKAHISLLIGEILSKESPTLQKLFAKARYPDQLRQERDERLLYAEAQGRETAANNDDEEDEGDD